MIDVGQDGLGRWAFMITTPRTERLIYSAWDFETEGDAYRAAIEAFDLFLAAARELEAKPAAAHALAGKRALLAGGDRGGEL